MPANDHNTYQPSLESFPRPSTSLGLSPDDPQSTTEKRKHNFINWDTSGSNPQTLLKSLPSLNTSNTSIEGTMQTMAVISEQLEQMVRKNSSPVSERLEEKKEKEVPSLALMDPVAAESTEEEVYSERRSLQQEEESEVVSQNSDSHNPTRAMANAHFDKSKNTDGSSMSQIGGMTMIDKGGSSIGNSSMLRQGCFDDIRRETENSIIYNWSQQTEHEFYKKENQSLPVQQPTTQNSLGSSNQMPVEIPQQVLKDVYRQPTKEKPRSKERVSSKERVK